VADYGVCKETCTGKNCNTNHKRPCVPTIDNDCGYNGAAFVTFSLLALLPLFL